MTEISGERADLLHLFADERKNFAITLRGLSDEQARAKATVSDLTLGGLTKHLAATQWHWCLVITEPDENAELDLESGMSQYYMAEDDTLAGLVVDFDDAAAFVDRVIKETPDLEATVPLPTAPWAPEREWWSVRRILLHILREVSHHAGHADLIRETLDGGSTTRALAEEAGMTF
ncbi:DinB family protein [Microlunatus speluncae]|uniref:DinB family protein n=1 Tax=Microlunatus speluncae TaxID=2594267 RepID=UPI001266221D|nr:DinB family protein [Microlunatus speluncae]